MNSMAIQSDHATIHSTTRRKAAGGSVTMGKLFAMAYRQRFVLAICIGGALLLGVLYVLLATPTYTAAASVQLEQQTASVLPSGQLQPDVPSQESERFLQTELDRILSRRTAEGVSRRLAIKSNPKLLAALGLEKEEATEDNIVGALQENANASLGLNTRLAYITFTSFGREASADIANAYADESASSTILSKSTTAAQAQTYLATEMADAKAKLEDSEKAMLAYARNADLSATVVPATGTGRDQGGSLRAQQLGQLNDSLANATARRIEAEQSWRQVQNVNAMALPEVQSNGAIQDLISQRAELDAAQIEQSQRYTENYPGAADVAAKRREYDAEITRLAGNIKSAYRTRYNAAAQEERELRGVVSGLRQSAMAERERGVSYNALQREVETNRAFYDGLLQRYKEVAANSGAPGQNIQVIDRAEPPSNATTPDPIKDVALAGVLGTILALGLGLVRERASNVVRSPDDAETLLHIRPLGAVPAFGKGETPESVILNPRTPQSEAYYSASVALYRMNGERRVKRALVTSCTPGEGKSTSSVAIARSLASMGKKVALLDGDLRRPSLGMMLGRPLGPGLGEVLLGKVAPHEAIVRPENLGFDLMTAGETDADPLTVLTGERLDRLLGTLGANYDIVVIDGPPMMGIADSVLLAEHVEAAVMVIEANSRDVEELDNAISRLPETLPIGAIVTKFDPRIAGVKYGRQSYYTY